MKWLPKFEVVNAASSFALIFVAGVAGHLAAGAGVDAKTAERGAEVIHVFSTMQTGFGITPEQISKTADSAETVHMWGGKRTRQDGRYWLRRNTVLSFEWKRMGNSKPDEPADAGEYMVDIHLEAKAAARGVVFESSAWRPDAK
jgi:hypothetical protein